MKVVFLKDAESDLHDLRTYFIHQFSNAAWRVHSRKLKQAILKLAEFPQIGNVPDEIAHLGISRYRQLIAGQTRVVYEIQSEIIFIHIVCDSRRNMRTLLTQRLLRS
ncbi:MAG: type II toxin-antitoxin system RelE/ParE family toxin [Thiobacillus sp.]|nr:type II toxin-antitoxin system RelE/ParE family toxin [Thiobacillus sp.]